MTRRSKRELERALEGLDGGDDDSPIEVVIRDRVVKTGWSDERGEHADAAPGDVVEESERVIGL